MGKVGKVGYCRDFCVSIKIGVRKYHYDPDMGIWYNNKGETDFYIPFDLDGMMVHFSAAATGFTGISKHLTTLNAKRLKNRSRKSLRKNTT